MNDSILSHGLGPGNAGEQQDGRGELLYSRVLATACGLLLAGHRFNLAEVRAKVLIKDAFNRVVEDLIAAGVIREYTTRKGTDYLLAPGVDVDEAVTAYYAFIRPPIAPRGADR